MGGMVTSGDKKRLRYVLRDWFRMRGFVPMPARDCPPAFDRLAAMLEDDFVSRPGLGPAGARLVAAHLYVVPAGDNVIIWELDEDGRAEAFDSAGNRLLVEEDGP